MNPAHNHLGTCQGKMNLALNPPMVTTKVPIFQGFPFLGNRVLGMAWLAVFSSGRRDQVNGPVCSTDFGSSDHCPTGCPGLSRRVCALRAGAMDAAPGLAAGGAGGDGGKDGGDWPDKSWVEPHRPSEGYYEKKKRKRKKKNKAKKGQPEEPEMGAEPGEEPTRPNIWFEGSLNSDARQSAIGLQTRKTDGAQLAGSRSG